MLKDKSAGFFAGCIAVILGIIAIALYFSNVSNAYFAEDPNASVVATSILGIVLLLLYMFLGNRTKNSKVLEYIRGLLPVAATFCLFAAFMTFFGTRVYNMAIIYGSSLEANNAAAHSAMAQAIATLVIYLLAGIAATASAFNSTEKLA